MNAEELFEAAELEQQRQASLKDRILCCSVAGCMAAGGSPAIRHAIEDEVRSQGLQNEVEVCGTGCLGLCGRAPCVRSRNNQENYEDVRLDDIPYLVRGDRSRFHGRTVRDSDLFYTGQHRIVLENAGRTDPERIMDYISVGGYQALFKAVSEMSPHDVIEEMKKSGLRGRGGAGYPTGLKWELVARQESPTKYVICNADEGDPGAFMDRSVLEGDPHRVLEGMAIAGFATGAAQGYIYVRGESPLAVERVRQAIRQAEREGLLGNRVLDHNFQFRVDLRIGAGAYVCGEETALIASIEGQRGSPRPRPPYPPERGLWGAPTLINNVETFANVAPIIRKGGAWFASIGTAQSKGTKVYALAGRITRTGLVEVPMGTTLRTLLFGIAGGVPDGYVFKAAQPGGPAGGCIPAQYLDLPMEFDSLLSIGSMIGSGGLIVMDNSVCMVDMARFFMEFCMDESCGKCVPCRAGTVQMHDILQRITRGEGTESDLRMLEELSGLLRQTSLCGLGMAASNPVMSTLRHFRNEYEAHIREGRCMAGSCIGEEVSAR
jgi:bidirectional [NiFe] hydrogenase diaphorase subunit